MKKEKYISEDHTRSIVRSIIWRIIGILFLALVTYLVTQSWIVTSLVTIIHHSISILGYYLHERLWLRIDQYKKVKYRSVCRMIVYELIGSVLVLSAITWLITGAVKQTSLITFLYVSNKLWMYIVYDKVWSNLSWRKRAI